MSTLIRALTWASVPSLRQLGQVAAAVEVIVALPFFADGFFAVEPDEIDVVDAGLMRQGVGHFEEQSGGGAAVVGADEFLPGKVLVSKCPVTTMALPLLPGNFAMMFFIAISPLGVCGGEGVFHYFAVRPVLAGSGCRIAVCDSLRSRGGGGRRLLPGGCNSRAFAPEKVAAVAAAERANKRTARRRTYISIYC